MLVGILHCLPCYITNYYYVFFIDLLLIVSVVDCKEPAVVSYGEFQFTNTTYGSTASLLCYSGYKVNDTEKVMTCADKGQGVNKLSCLSKSLSLFLSPLGPLLPPRGARVWGGGHTFAPLHFQIGNKSRQPCGCSAQSLFC